MRQRTGSKPSRDSVQVTDRHLRLLRKIEAGVHYDEPPPAGQKPFVVKDGAGCVMLSAPHGARTYRNSSGEIWHEEDEYTAGFALLLSEILRIPAIALMSRSNAYDPNHTTDCEYKQVMRQRIQDKGIRYVIDLHGAALHSRALDDDQTIDLGLRSKDASNYSLNRVHVDRLTRLLLCCARDAGLRDCFVVRKNNFPAKDPGTITSFASAIPVAGTDQLVQAVQIEMKPQVRVLERMRGASLFPSCGPFSAKAACVRLMLQTLVDFVHYLNKKCGKELTR